MRALLLAGAISMAFTLTLTPMFIWLFRKWNWGQFIRDDGPESHHTKRGTPTMGGLVIILASVTGYFSGKFLNGETATVSALLVILAMVGLGLVGFVDDFIKTQRQRSLGSVVGPRLRARRLLLRYLQVLLLEIQTLAVSPRHLRKFLSFETPDLI